MTKVTYNTYSCSMSGMSREMMKMDGRGRAECQNWEKNDKMVILEINLSYNKTKGNSASSPSLSQTKKNVGSRFFLVQ